jgi:hypothetical protein
MFYYKFSCLYFGYNQKAKIEKRLESHQASHNLTQARNDELVVWNIFFVISIVDKACQSPAALQSNLIAAVFQ